ncbi:alpha/beta fold hydrolase [Nesterenkonia ebinurensis]|uniref:alpha/beta fold hydrolase n=1 Tax=Nesterenkonia ebinurensis TaxID=2608252 RepID=UPI00168A4EBA|nr:alpha/beta hydrolase [Nesterenkonia ebinurensis]
MGSDTVISADGTRIAYDATGDESRPVLLRVEGAATHRALNPGRAKFTDRLSGRFCVVSYDRCGRGDSDDRDAYAVEREIEDVAALLDRFNGRGFIVGLSSGAVLALRCAVEGLPIDGLACYEPPFIVSSDRTPVAADYVERLQAEISSGRPGKAMKLFMVEAVGMPAVMVDGMAGQPFWPAMEQLAHTLVYDARVMGETMQGRPEMIDIFADVSVPTLVMSGSASAPWLRTAAAKLTQLLTNGNANELPEQTHDVDPVLLADTIGEYFSTLSTHAENHQ